MRATGVEIVHTPRGSVSRASQLPHWAKYDLFVILNISTDFMLFLDTAPPAMITFVFPSESVSAAHPWPRRACNMVGPGIHSFLSML